MWDLYSCINEIGACKHSEFRSRSPHILFNSNLNYLMMFFSHSRFQSCQQARSVNKMCLYISVATRGFDLYYCVYFSGDTWF